MNVTVNYIYNLALTRRVINIIQSDFDWNEYIGYSIPGQSISSVLKSRRTSFFARGDSFLLN
jgi:hypothetical protein